MSFSISRRKFLGGAALAVGGAFFNFRANAVSLTGRIFGVSTLDPADGRTELSKVVQLDLVTGETHYFDLPEHRFGHSLVPLKDGGFLAIPYGDDRVACQFLDKSLQPIGEIKAPDGHGFGGHGVLLADERHVFTHFNQAAYLDKRAPDQTGQLCVIDVLSQEVVKTQPTRILHAHDVLITNDGKNIVVGDDGTLETRVGDALKADDNPFALVPGSPQFVVFDAQSMAVQKTIPLDINGAVVHIAESRNGMIHGAVEQFVANSEAGHAALRSLLGEDVPRYVDQLDEKMVQLGVELPYPGPIIGVDLATEAVTEVTSPMHQMPFDIVKNQKSGRMFNVFTASHMLARFDPIADRWGYFPTDVYGISQPYGLTDIPGTTLVAVNGFMEGIAIVDAETMGLVRRYDTNNFGIKHLQYQA